MAKSIGNIWCVLDEVTPAAGPGSSLLRKPGKGLCQGAGVVI